MTKEQDRPPVWKRLYVLMQAGAIGVGALVSILALGNWSSCIGLVSQSELKETKKELQVEHTEIRQVITGLETKEHAQEQLQIIREDIKHQGETLQNVDRGLNRVLGQLKRME